jgi:hypothetical protein
MAQKTTIKAWIVDRNIRKLLPVQKKNVWYKMLIISWLLLQLIISSN